VLPLRYTVFNPDQTKTVGSGHTINLSSSGLCFTADTQLAVGQRLEVSIQWPVQLQGRAQIQLLLVGEVVRTSGSTAALRCDQHQFKTLSLGPKLVAGRR